MTILATCRIFLFLLPGLLLQIEHAGADQVLLKNGDRLSGVIVEQNDDIVRIETPYAGSIEIKRSTVASTATGKTETANATTEAPQKKPATKVTRKGHVNVAASYSRGNTTNDHMYAEAAYSKRTADYRYSLGGKFNRASEGGTRTASNALADGSHDWFLNGSDFWYIRGSAERDRFKDIEARYTAGTGYGLQLLDSDRSQLTVRAGPDLVAVNRFTGENENYPALGWGIDFSHWLIPDRLEAFHNQDGFWNLDDTNQVTVRSRTGVRMPLTERIHANLQLNLDWENEPTPGRDSTDSTWLVGAGYKF